jgi:biotin carboxyl carrier protein
MDKVEGKAPAKGPAVRTFNVFVGDEYYKVEVEPTSDQVTFAPPPAYAPPQPPAPPVAKEAPAPSTTVAAGETPLLAPIPGTIIRYLVKEGDAVKANTGIVILEAMKMENEIVAPVSGKIKSINCKPGDKVSGGTVLAIIG